MKHRLILATRNAHKAQEISAMLGAQVELLTLNQFANVPVLKEETQTFAGNATQKAVQLAQWLVETRQAGSLHFVLADDSGLEVDALNGAPGVHSARFAAFDTGRPGNSTDADNNAKLLRLLERIPDDKRHARFRCVLALTPLDVQMKENASPTCLASEFELRTELFEGACEGRIARSGQGKHGFGYDPLFYPSGFDQSFAELGEEIKNKISHRATAMGKLRQRLEGR